MLGSMAMKCSCVVLLIIICVLLHLIKKKARGSCKEVSGLARDGVTEVPKCFILPRSQRPNKQPGVQHDLYELPVIDLSALNDPIRRPQLVQEVGTACKNLGCFQVINHQIALSVIQGALLVASEFFSLSNEEKSVYASGNVRAPVRYGTSVNQMIDSVQYWRDFLKLYANPISTWIHQWPSNPPIYKKKMGEYLMAVHILQQQLMEVVFEGLGLNPRYLEVEIKDGVQIVTVNNYSTCPQPELVLGIPPHSDYSYITILTQNNQGLEVLNQEGIWLPVHCGEKALMVMLGDLMEIITNGQYKGPMHRATVDAEKPRISIASLHGFPMDQKVGTAKELIGGEHVSVYKEESCKDFLDYITKTDITKKRYIDYLKRTADN